MSFTIRSSKTTFLTIPRPTWFSTTAKSKLTFLITGLRRAPTASLSNRTNSPFLIGPLLFLILIGDIDRNIAHSFLTSFADDTRLLREVKGVQDASALQSDLEEVYQWAIDNNASFNNKKFEALRHGSDETLKVSTNYTAPDGTIITEKTHLRDLGVTMSADGTFQQHIKNTCQSARNMCSWILRTF